MDKKVLFFGDFGIDDAIAFIYAFLSKKINIVGIVADYGNVSREMVLQNVDYLIKKTGLNDIPVISGASRPLTGESPIYYPAIHGPNGLGPVIPSAIKKNKRENFFEVIDIIKKYENEIIIVNTGRLTSLATLFVLYGALMENVHSYYIMGGAFLCPGNVTPVSEANFYSDPIAANLVMKYAKKATIYPLNVTRNTIVSPEMTNYIAAKGKTDLVKPLIDYYYYHFYKQNYPGSKGSPVHDVLPMMSVIHDDLCRYVEAEVIIDLSNGLSRGQSIGDFRPVLNNETFGRTKQRIAVELHYKKFFSEFMTVMTGEHFKQE
ncbi:nucleoside hydrolase [Fictibacillus sp. Mic-4]|uniref:nucleoside hydrolase n=1 Tax=Fictibacillus TaxID=1329200 RepID=UPI0004182798|nr:nucleoside hydrolase [Fictibacillus gelatini]